MTGREQRLVFGDDPELYDAARPGYPGELVDDVVSLVGPAARALDVGCGTGKAAVLLAARGLNGIGVEAHPAMAALAKRNLAPYPGWQVDVSDFEAWGPAGRSGTFDFVCSAQAWHWLDPEVRLHKAHALLRRGGWLALWWNRAAGGGSPLRQAFDDVYSAIAPSVPSGGIASKGSPPPEEDASGLPFGEPVSRSYAWSRDYTADEWVALLRTQSDHMLLPAARLDQLTGEIRRLVQEHGDLYRHDYVCRLWAVQKV